MRLSGTLLVVVVLCGGAAFAVDDEDKEDEIVMAQRLLVDLTNGTTRERADAAGELGGVSADVAMSQGVVDALSGALADDVPFVKVAIVDSLQSMYPRVEQGSQKKIKGALADVIEDSEGNAAVRARAIRALIGRVNESAYDDKGIFREIDKIAKDEKQAPLVLSAAWQFQIAYNRSLPVDNILAGLKSKAPEDQRRALGDIKNILARNTEGKSLIPPRRAADMLEMAQEKERTVEIRSGLIAVVSIIHKHGTKVPGVPDEFEDIAKDKDVDMAVREAAIVALGRTGEPDSAKSVLRVFEEQKNVEGDDAGMLRTACCEAAGEFFPMLADRGRLTRYKLEARDLVQMLIHTIDNDLYTPAVVAAVLAAANMDPRGYDCSEVLDAIIEALNDPAESVRSAAMESLMLLTGTTLGGYEAWREWYDRPGVRDRFSGKM